MTSLLQSSSLGWELGKKGINIRKFFFGWLENLQDNAAMSSSFLKNSPCKLTQGAHYNGVLRSIADQVRAAHVLMTSPRSADRQTPRDTEPAACLLHSKPRKVTWHLDDALSPPSLCRGLCAGVSGTVLSLCV